MEQRVDVQIKEVIFDRMEKSYHYIMKLRKWEVQQDNTLYFEGLSDENVTVKIKIYFVSDEIFRLVMTPIDEFITKQTLILEEFANTKIKPHFEEGGDSLYIRTQKITLQLKKEPFQITIFDKNNKKIFSESINDTLGWPKEFVVYPIGYSKKNNEIVEVFDSAEIFPDEHFYGLGEKYSKLDKLHQKIVCWIKDTGALNTTDLSYKSVPFFMSTNGYGIYVNSTTKTIFEMGSRSYLSYTFLVSDSQLDYFFIYGPSLKEILFKYTQLTGRAELPPKWSFGIWMSRNAYRSREEVEEVAEKLRKYKLPCDVLHLDPPWRKSHRKNVGDCFDYEFDEEKFPNPEEMVKKLNSKGFKVSLWINPYVVENTKVFEETSKNNLLVKNKNGLPISHQGRYFIDFTNPNAVEYYREKLKKLLEIGVSVFKTDYGEETHPEGIYYNGLTGKEAHNLYPFLYNKTVFELMKEIRNEGIVWARSACQGSQRFPLWWSGDSQSNFHTMLCVLRSGLSFGLSGFPFWAHDIGAYLDKPTEKLYIRWCQFGFLSSHSRLHGVTPREPWEYGERAVKIFREFANLRYRLIPYLYSQARISTLTGLPLMRALVLEFQDDPNIYDKDTQYMLGESLLVAPIFSEENYRYVYLPKGQWTDFWTGKIHNGPSTVKYYSGLNKIPIFVKENSIIPMGPKMDYVGQKEFNPIELNIYLNKESSFELYDNKEIVKIVAKKSNNSINLRISKSTKKYIINFHNIKRKPKKVIYNDQKVKPIIKKNILQVKIHPQNTSTDISIHF